MRSRTARLPRTSPATGDQVPATVCTRHAEQQLHRDVAVDDVVDSSSSAPTCATTTAGPRRVRSRTRRPLSVDQVASSRSRPRSGVASLGERSRSPTHHMVWFVKKPRQGLASQSWQVTPCLACCSGHVGRYESASFSWHAAHLCPP